MITWKESFKFDVGVEMGLTETGVYFSSYEVGGGYSEKVSMKE
jgi:hypothetical protein